MGFDNIVASPPARGWTLRRSPEQDAVLGVPARAGMEPARFSQTVDLAKSGDRRHVARNAYKTITPCHRYPTREPLVRGLVV
jgi:hypothetical protein